MTNNLTKSTDKNVKNENIAFKVKNNARFKMPDRRKGYIQKHK